MSTIFSVFLLFSLTNYRGGTGQVNDICSTRDLTEPLRTAHRTLFLGLGEGGILTASNVSRQEFGNINFHEVCRMDIVTCPSCVVSLNFRLLNLSCYCGHGSNLFLHNPCRCDYVWVSEPPYSETSGVSFCRILPLDGSDVSGYTYRSKTRAVRIWFFYSKSHAHAFTLDYKSERNRQVFFGTCQHAGLNSSTGLISSPFFPAVYPPDLVAEYVLICIKPTNLTTSEAPMDGDKSCRVQLTFTDFHLASASVMEFYDGSRRVGVVRGTSFRPPIIVSKTNSLSMRFFSFGYNNMGFKALFSFVSKEKAEENFVKPSTDCGGYVDNFGGTITMVKMVKSHVKVFDCIWLIKPLKSFSNSEGYLYLKLTTFLGFVNNAELEIRRGLTSESPVLETLRHTVVQSFQEHVVSLRSGFYVSLKAAFGPGTKFSVTYASFTLNKCAAFPGFLCKNFRCIEKKLICDGSDHCGDNSDESAACDQRWGSDSLDVGNKARKLGGRFQTPNYYFPKINDYSNPKMASVVFLVSLLGLVFLTSSVTVAIHRMASRAPRQTNLQDELHSVANFRDCLSDELSVEDVVVDDPPSYEHPPHYDDVVKASSDSVITHTDFRKIGFS